MILCIYIPVLDRNQYILSFLLIFAAQGVSSLTLLAITGSKEDVSSVHHLETEKKKQSQERSFDVTVGSRSQRSGPSSVVVTPVQNYASRLPDPDMDSSTKPLTSPSVALTILPSSSTHGFPELLDQSEQSPEQQSFPRKTIRTNQKGTARLEEIEWENDPEREMSSVRGQTASIAIPSDLVNSTTEEQLLALTQPGSSPHSGDKEEWNVQ